MGNTTDGAWPIAELLAPQRLLREVPQRPSKFAVRFSANAASPSCRSSLEERTLLHGAHLVGRVGPEHARGRCTASPPACATAP